jgi:ankyrin repeat protein
MDSDLDEQLKQESLHFAAERGDLEEVRRLLATGAPVDAFDDLSLTPLHYAVRRGHLEVAKALLDAGANVNAADEAKAGNTPLADVARDCSLEVARFLLDHGADPRVPGWMQLSALKRAEQRKGGDGPAIVHAMWDAVKRSK